MRHALLAGLLFLLATGCSTTRYREAADREVYDIIQEKAPEVPGFDDTFTIESNPVDASLPDVPKRADDSPALGDFASSEPAPSITLAHALKLAIEHNREYQQRKEAVYLAALALTADRDEFRPFFQAVASGTYDRRTRDELRASQTTEALARVDTLLDGLETLTGDTATVLRSYQSIVEEAATVAGANDPRVEIVEETRGNFSGGFNVDLLLRSGARIALDFTSSFLRLLQGGDFEDDGATFDASIIQPLLRGAGTRVTLEALTQSEREVLYALRDFARFRMEFAVDVCSAYYDVLQNRDIVENNYAGLQSFRVSVERERALAEEGRTTAAALGRLEQALLSRDESWTDSVRQYRDSLDSFKILLGLPTDTPLLLDPKELEDLRAHGLRHPEVNAEDSVRVALVTRVDLDSVRDRTEDAARQVKLAENAFLPGLDIVATAALDSEEDGNVLDLDTRRARWSVGLNLDPGLERLEERNAYRRALIAEERALRARTLAEDQVALQVRGNARNLEAAQRNYEIALRGVALNERRVEEQELLAELGRATVLDQVDAQNDLTDAQNALTAALIRHTLARLAHWRDMGVLYIRPDGQWEELENEPVKEAPTTAG